MSKTLNTYLTVFRVVSARQTKVGRQFWEADSKEGYVIYDTRFDRLSLALCLMGTAHAGFLSDADTLR